MYYFLGIKGQTVPLIRVPSCVCRNLLSILLCERISFLNKGSAAKKSRLLAIHRIAYVTLSANVKCIIPPTAAHIVDLNLCHQPPQTLLPDLLCHPPSPLVPQSLDHCRQNKRTTAREEQDVGQRRMEGQGQ